MGDIKKFAANQTPDGGDDGDDQTSRVVSVPDDRLGKKPESGELDWDLSIKGGEEVVPGIRSESGKLVVDVISPKENLIGSKISNADLVLKPGITNLHELGLPLKEGDPTSVELLDARALALVCGSNEDEELICDLGGKTFVGHLVPGVVQDVDHPSKNRAGFGLVTDVDNNKLQIFAADAKGEGSSGEKDAAILANGALVSVAHALNFDPGITSSDMLSLMDKAVKGLKSSSSIAPNSSNVAVLAAELDLKEHVLEVSSAGDIQYFVIHRNPESEAGFELDSLPVQTVWNKWDKNKLGARAERLSEASKDLGLSEEAVAGAYTMAAGFEKFEPVDSKVGGIGEGDIIVLASSSLMKDLGSDNGVQQIVMAKALTAGLAEGTGLDAVTSKFMKWFEAGKQSGSAFLVAFEVPEKL
ncbi:MAG: hypothetical protein WC843_02375 [Candidatus Gracilibacteria bacterium]|jgi:hypothetical protein